MPRSRDGFRCRRYAPWLSPHLLPIGDCGAERAPYGPFAAMMIRAPLVDLPRGTLRARRGSRLRDRVRQLHDWDLAHAAHDALDGGGAAAPLPGERRAAIGDDQLDA